MRLRKSLVVDRLIALGGEKQLSIGQPRFELVVGSTVLLFPLLVADLGRL